MKGGTFFDVGDAERARILDVARRLGSVRWPATAVVTAAVASAATVAGAAVILSTHVLAEVVAVCDRVVILHEGRLRHDAPLSRDADGTALESHFFTIATGAAA